MRYGGIEAGGTKFVYGVADENGNILDRQSCPTTDPQDTMSKVIDYFKDKNIDAVGIGSFGPVDLDASSPTFGYITNTPKLKWQNYDIYSAVADAFPELPVGFDTDVNGAALAESVWGAAKGVDSCLYITVGTGIGGGLLINGGLVHGMSHPEMGHILINKHKDDDFEGVCPFHKNCLEGLASGPSIQARGGTNDKTWEIEAYYLAQALMNFILTASPKKIIMGGGVMHQLQLFPMIRKNVTEMLNGYITIKDIDSYIVPPALGDDSGLLGAAALARKAYNS